MPKKPKKLEEKKSQMSSFFMEEFKRPDLKLNDKKAEALKTLMKDEYFKDRLGSCEDILKAYEAGKRSQN
jgi:hypothetical protein